jgi:hypothetical protein
VYSTSEAVLTVSPGQYGSAVREAGLALSVLHDLQEDFDTAWVPDVLAGADFAALIDEPDPAPDPPTLLSVPRPGRQSMRVPVLSFDYQVKLHRACRPIMDRVDQRLRPEVCGYRTGARAEPGYRDEYGRYRDFLSSGIGESAWTATADVQGFFSSVTLRAMQAALRTITADSDTQVLEALLLELIELGLPTLPAGYADARMLGNLLLGAVDAVIEIPFTRWVDDYRLFSQDHKTIVKSLLTVEQQLRQLGMQLNASKTHIYPREAARNRLLGLDLTSVFHPEIECDATTRRSLRRVFISATSAAIPDRRVIRFCLPRFIAMRDDFAIDYALAALTSTPWDAPRLVHYLSVFRERSTVAERLCGAVEQAARASDDWMVARLCVAVAGLRLPEATIAALHDYAERTLSAPVWGLAIRTLSLSGDAGVSMVAARALDTRAALAAHRDLDLPLPALLVERAPTTARVLDTMSAPAPSAVSLL